MEKKSALSSFARAGVALVSSGISVAGNAWSFGLSAMMAAYLFAPAKISALFGGGVFPPSYIDPVGANGGTLSSEAVASVSLCLGLATLIPLVTQRSPSTALGKRLAHFGNYARTLTGLTTTLGFAGCAAFNTAAPIISSLWTSAPPLTAGQVLVGVPLLVLVAGALSVPSLLTGLAYSAIVGAAGAHCHGRIEKRKVEQPKKKTAAAALTP
jgi:hypothetical protein